MPGSDAAGRATRRLQLLKNLSRWSQAGIDFVQLREKRLDAAELFSLAEAAMTWLRNRAPANASARPKLLINSRTDIAAASGADGVHLTADPGELRPAQVRELFRAAGLPTCIVSLSCHSEEDLLAARELGADLLLVGPVFEKRIAGHRIAPGLGLEHLRHCCELAQPTPVLALGGITERTVPACLQAGAAGVAGIRLFS